MIIVTNISLIMGWIKIHISSVKIMINIFAIIIIIILFSKNILIFIKLLINLFYFI